MTNKKFSFKFLTEDLVREEIKNLGGSKATPNGDISVDILKSNVDIHLPFIKNSINLSIGEVSQIFKNKDDLDKEKSRPACVKGF